MNSVASIFWECLKFIRNHWVHLVILIPAAIAYTFVHESLHALAVIVQGGKMVEFVWVPSPKEWGHVRYEFPEGQVYSELVILLAPYLLPLVLLLSGTAILAVFFMGWKPMPLLSEPVLSLSKEQVRRVTFIPKFFGRAGRQVPRWKEKAIPSTALRTSYFWLFLVPVFDLAHAAIPYQLGARNDFYYAFGRPTLFSSYVISFLGAFLAFSGYILQKKIYQSEQLSVQAYMVLAVLVVLIVLLLSL